jgi:phenylalanyl-tRNA synthetase alpha chain
MDEKVLESLSPIERKILPNIGNGKELDVISERSGTDNTTTLRALEFLKNKNIVTIDTKEKSMIILGINGVYYQKKGLPERKLLNALTDKKSIPLGELKNVSDLNENEAKISIGVLKKKALAEIKEGRVVLTASDSEIKK